MQQPDKKIGDNDAFVTLIRVAQEDPEVRKILAGILELPPYHRTSLLNTLIEEMKLKGAPSDFTLALSALLDDDVAQNATKLLTK